MGRSIAAVREPSEPSMKALRAPVFSQGRSKPHSLRSSSSLASGSVKSSHSVMRAVKLPFLAELLVHQEIIRAEGSVATELEN